MTTENQKHEPPSNFPTTKPKIDSALAIRESATRVQQELVRLSTSSTTGLFSEAMSLIGEYLPFTKRLGFQGRSNLAMVRGDMRANILEMSRHENQIAVETDQRSQKQRLISSLIDQAVEEPENNEPIEQLDELLQEKARQDLQFETDPEGDKIVEQVLRASPEFQTQKRQQILAFATRTQSNNASLINAQEALLIVQAVTLKRLRYEYNELLDLSPEHDSLNRSAQTLVEAISLGIDSVATQTQNLDFTILAADLVLRAQELNKKMDPENAKKRAEIDARATEIKQRFLGKSPVPQAPKQLES